MTIFTKNITLDRLVTTITVFMKTDKRINNTMFFPLIPVDFGQNRVNMNLIKKKQENFISNVLLAIQKRKNNIQ